MQKSLAIFAPHVPFPNFKGPAHSHATYCEQSQILNRAKEEMIRERKLLKKSA